MENWLPEEILGRLREIREAEIVVGIPSYNNAATIGHVVRAVAVGLEQYWPERRAVILNSDGGSKDSTREAVLSAQHDSSSLVHVLHPVHPIQRISTPYHGIPGKGSAFRLIFGVAQLLKAKACVVVDADLRSITPQWIELLAGPILARDFDYVAPYYMRHKFDGTITNGIIYPMARMLFGMHVRQPIGGEFGISGRLAAHYLSKKDVWETDVARFGIDIWMTETAVAEGFKIGQAYLGAKLHNAKDPGADLTSMFKQVVGSLFRLMETYEAVWQKGRESTPVPMFGFPFEVGVEPVAVNVERMGKAFCQGLKDLAEIYKAVLSPKTLEGLTACAARTGNDFRVPDSLWVDVILEFASSFHHKTIDREHLLESLVPLYLGRTASFVLEMRESNPAEVEGRIEELCRVFEARRPYLLKLWNLASPDGVGASQREVGHATNLG